MTPTKSRQNVDAPLTTRGSRLITLTPMSNPVTARIQFRHLRVFAASLALALAGCATPVLKPSLDVPERFAATAAAADEPEVAWWEGFKDPVLSDLIRRAAQRNRDVKIAAERLRAARAGETISRSWLFPTVNVVGAAFDHKTNYDSVLKNFVPEAANTKAAQIGVGVTWEVDLFGRLRAGADAAAAETLAVQNGARGVRLLVLSDVASNYFTLVGALRQLKTVRAISAAHDETLRLVTARQRVGLATPFDVERAQTEASRARAVIPPLETLAAVSRHRIAVLIGDQAFNAASITPSTVEPTVPPARPGQPAELLQRRPDLLAASAQLDAANARRQQAMAEWFPRLILGGVFGRESISLNGEGLGPARFTNVAALLAMPIFNAGRTQAINDIAESGQREAVLRYEDAIARALEDVENALVALDDQRHRAQLMQSAAASADAALGHAQSLYDRGQTDFLPLLDAQRVRLVVRVSANEADTQLLLDSVQLYKALGGGWQAFEPVSRARCVRQPEFAEIMKLRRPIRGSVVNPSLAPALVVVAVIAVASCPRAHRSRPLKPFAPCGPPDPLRQDAGNEPLRRHGAVAPRSQRGISRRRQGRAAQGRRRTESARGRRAGGARRHRLPARRGRSAAAVRRRHDAGPAGRVRSAPAQRVEKRRLGERIRRREGTDGRADRRRRQRRPRRGSSSLHAIG